MNLLSKIISAFAFLAISTLPATAASDHILVQSTTSTQNSGFYDYILPIFTHETGIEVRVVAVGTGEAIRNAANGDADVLLVHAKAAEEAFIANGHGIERFELMYNDFVIIGPTSDPINLGNAETLMDALALLATGGAIFVSRGDDSGTHIKELALWGSVGFQPTPSNWYRETGSGMGSTLRATIEMQGYTVTDRATWIAYGHKADAEILFEGGVEMFNQYSIIALNPVKHPHVNAKRSQVFIEWMLSTHGQALIGAYVLDGQQLFFPNAR